MAAEATLKFGVSTWATRALFVLATVFALREARALLAPVVIAIVLTFVLAPGVRFLHRHGMPEVLGALLMVVALLGSTVPVAAGLARPAALWWQAAPETLEQLLKRLDELRANIPGMRPPAPAAPAQRPSGSGSGRGSTASATLAPAMPALAPPDPLKDKLASEGLALTGALLGHSASFLVSAAACVILLYFLLASEHWMLSRTVEALPQRRNRALVLGGVRAAQRQIGHYLLALGCINGAVGLLTALAVWWLGLPNPMMWGVVAAVLGFVPYIGPLVIAGLLLLSGLTHFSSVPDMLAPAAAYLVIHAIESNIVSPWIVGRRLSLSPIAVFLSVMFWGWLWGIAGAVIAVPVLIALRNLMQRTRRLRLLRRFLEGERTRPPSLRSLLRLPPQLRRGRWAPPPQLPDAQTPTVRG